MEFGGCLANTAIKFMELVDIDNQTIRVGFKEYNEPLMRLREYYL